MHVLGTVPASKPSEEKNGLKRGEDGLKAGRCAVKPFGPKIERGV